MSDIFNEIETIKNKSAVLKDEKVAKFAYTDTAYANDDAVGKTDYDYARDQNVPNKDTTDFNAVTLDKGVRSQAASIPRMALNHFFGRVSYNLNKVLDWFDSILSSLLRSEAMNAHKYSATSKYKNGDMCYTVDLVNFTKSLYMRYSTDPVDLVGIDPSNATHWKLLDTELSTARTFMKRDSAGRSRVEDPDNDLDVANKRFVVNQIASISGTPDATPDTFMKRDSLGRAKVMPPGTDDQIALLSTVKEYTNRTDFDLYTADLIAGFQARDKTFVMRSGTILNLDLTAGASGGIQITVVGGDNGAGVNVKLTSTATVFVPAKAIAKFIYGETGWKMNGTVGSGFVVRLTSGSAQTWYAPVGGTFDVTVVGGGGGSGALKVTGSSNAASGGGGGGGKAKKKYYLHAGQPCTYTVGGGGSAGVSSTPTAGGTGGTSSFTDGTNAISATGGSGSGAVTTSQGVSAAGAGGSGSGGDENVQGSDGGASGAAWYGSLAAGQFGAVAPTGKLSSGGSGGFTPGFSSPSAWQAAASDAVLIGSAPRGNGGGGGGSCGGSSSSLAVNGRAGGGGIIVIEW